MGVSGPQVVEGWYGQPFAKPLARTREVVDIIRQVLAREAPVTNDGPHYPLPYTGEGSVGLGKPLKPIVHPLRADIPIWLGAEGPKNVAQTAEIADGWIPIFYSPKSADMYQPWLDEGFARPAPGVPAQTSRSPPPATCRSPTPTRRSAAIYDVLQPGVALYMGGMGAKEQNFHKQVFDRMGYAELTDEVQELYLAGKKDEATALIPDELVDDMHIIGTRRGRARACSLGGDRRDHAAADAADRPTRCAGSRRCSHDTTVEPSRPAHRHPQRPPDGRRAEAAPRQAGACTSATPP